ncbi:tyrosine-type recombinase/integrase [Staphylococcus sp. NRL 16/872]|uniref:tyrosine-type recombinase/integrase n=1 Tax=Staphylococcus sp. NRL 16/872 TaxID=2930131 RepID=UPI001FB1B564|nr:MULTISPECIES: tyrosine-type recombinase/integrase [unclassified Staphylococcus]MCJ1657018.1 tyrosine-type recombinase/integrase [Staphylococcus sp. NRL 21/187]MCJ1662765.1 tyrosine-type recombinase/integrase [Staphylococcus sp. NRL 18/288]MCJ1668874.1 tyrosine-type recombinase/integrase [Staphylococcus sp. NRL 19/737]WEN69090.1 tyrosine-type recombinase/integrase [Staphylococcus sp. NRL 16/872]
MNQVEPIRNKEDIKRMYQILKAKSERDYLLFKLAIHTGIRLIDLLNLKVEEVLKQDEEVVVSSWIQQYEPSIKIMLPEDLRIELKTYIEKKHLTCDQLLFQSLRTHRELSRQQAYRIIHQAAEELDLIHIGLTTLRKTFAYHAYKSGISIAIIQKYLGHQTTQETVKFIGLPSKEEHHTIIALNL